MEKSLLATVAVAALFASTAAYAISVTGNATAVIKAAITATQTQQMDFGTISASGTAGTATLSPAGVVTSGLDHYGAPKNAVFTITAEPNTALTVSFTNGTLTSGANNMTVSNFTRNTTPGADTTNGSGALTMNVGADLAVAANQASGTYTGTYTLTLSY